LRRELDGDLLLPSQPRYAGAQRLYDPRFDDVRPAAVVQAASTDDVAATLRFADRHGLTVRPRSGGHSYVGASTVDAGIQLDVTGLNTVRYDSASKQVLVGAGAELFDVHVALDAHGRTLPTGTCATVGAAGLTLGGGMGVEGSAYGLTCDNLLQATIVTADGTVHTTNAHRDPDLFWACRGGGGGNLGVVTSMRFATHPAGQVGSFTLTYAGRHAAAALAGWQRRVPAMPRTAWANLHLEAVPGGMQARIACFVLTGDAHAEAAAMVAAIGVDPDDSFFALRSHHDAMRVLAGCGTLSDAECAIAPHGSLPRAAFTAGSDVLSRPLSAAERGRLVDVVRLRGRARRAGVVIIDPLAGAVHDLGVGDTAFPWRTAFGVAQWYVGLPATRRNAAYRDARGWIGSGHVALGGVSVGGYVNYLEPGRTVASYYGPNFTRLRALRRRFDPANRFASPYSIPL